MLVRLDLLQVSTYKRTQHRFDLAEAAGYATRADQLAPCHASAIGLGLIYRDLGLTSEALDAFERALSYKPDSLEVYADICDLLLDADRLDEALTYARRALAIDAGHICSQIAALAVRFRQTRKAADLDALMEFCRAQPADTHARRHGERVLQSTVMKTASRTATLTGSPREVLAQFRRFTRAGDRIDHARQPTARNRTFHILMAMRSSVLARYM
jgi:tetratricopeptide (TPR) repeat protein